MDENDDNLFNEALLDLAIILKRNNDLINENNELRKRMEEKNNDSNKSREKSSSHKN